MTATPDLIDRLVAGAAPVRRAWSPAGRAAAWLLLAGAVVSGLAVLHGTRADLAQRLGQESYCIGFAAALGTGVLAALAAFMVSLPDRSRLWLLLPVPTAMAWVGTIGYGCLAHWVNFDPAALAPGEGVRCLTTLVASFLPLSATMFWLLRRSARLRPRAATLAAGLAVGALTACALSLLHEFDASALVLIWNFGAAALVAALDVGIGRVVLRPA